MRAVVMYESMFGNTRDVASAIAEGLAIHGDVEVVDVGAADRTVEAEVDLLVIGGPTHAFGLSRRKTRADAVKQKGSAPVSSGDGIREWLDRAGRPARATAAAAFDTKVDKPIPGSAARAAEKRLRRLGYLIAAAAATFRVADVAGPLKPGELDRARAWGDQLGAALLARGAPHASGEVKRPW